MKPGPVEHLAKQARAISEGFAVLITLASPKVCEHLSASGGALPPPPRVSDYLEALIGALEGGTFGRSTMKNSSSAIPTLRAVQRFVLEGDGKRVSPEVREGARLALEVLDYPEPPCGWDAFEGPKKSGASE